MKFIENRVMLSDSYKYSQPPQYPLNQEGMFDYMESRGGEYSETVFFGLQYLLIRYFSNPITMEEVEEAKKYSEAHGEPFAYEDWIYIVNHLKGMLPVKIRAVKEGSIVPSHNVLMTIESTDSRVPWIVGWLETILMKLWYPITVASKSRNVKLMLENYADKYSDSRDHIEFQFHNFGDRGSSSVEAAAIGGMAHLTQFLGTDNFNSLRYATSFYNSPCAGYSIPASEHSTVTSWGKDQEFAFYDNYLETFSDKPIVACVMDSYDIYNAVDYVTKGDFKSKVESKSYPIWVIRPDSGEPEIVIKRILDIITKNDVHFSINSKGLKLLNKYRIIWGDGINQETMKQILNTTIEEGFAPENIAFGSGGWLMQQLDRDTNKFAIKCSSVEIADLGGKYSRDVFKSPITDPGKKSKAGKLELIKRDGQYLTVRREDVQLEDFRQLEDVWIDGKLVRFQDWSEICLNSDS